MRNHLERVGESIFFRNFSENVRKQKLPCERRFRADLSFRMRQSRGNKITRPRKFFEVALFRGRRYNSSHPGPSSTSRRSRVRIFFIFTRAIYVAKINGWRKRVSGDTLLKIQPRAAAAHQER